MSAKEAVADWCCWRWMAEEANALRHWWHSDDGRNDNLRKAPSSDIWTGELLECGALGLDAGDSRELSEVSFHRRKSWHIVSSLEALPFIVIA